MVVSAVTLRATNVLLLAHQDQIPALITLHLSANATVKVISEKYQLVQSLLINPPDLIVADSGLPCLEGLEVLRMVRQYFPQMPFIYLYEADSPALAAEALLEGATTCLAYHQLSKISVVMEQAQLSHPDFALDQASRRIKTKIRENLAGLNEIRDFWSEEPVVEVGSLSSSIRAELDESIAYLQQLDENFSPASRWGS